MLSDTENPKCPLGCIERSNPARIARWPEIGARSWTPVALRTPHCAVRLTVPNPPVADAGMFAIVMSASSASTGASRSRVCTALAPMSPSTIRKMSASVIVRAPAMIACA
jgi:hypothetical protein